MALQLRQALALCWVPQDDLSVTPAARKKLAVERPGQCVDNTAAIFSNVREHICSARLRLSPAERGKLTTFRKMRLPVALELLELLATVNIPQADRLVTRTDELRWIRRVEMDATDRSPAIVSNVSFTGNCSTPLPRLAGRGRRQNPYFNGFAYRR